MENNLRQLLENYRKACLALRLFRQANYQTGRCVVVDAEKYKGEGIAVADSLCPITQIPVRLENGNVWYYDMADLTPKPSCPPEITVCNDCGENTPETGFVCDECKLNALND